MIPGAPFLAVRFNATTLLTLVSVPVVTGDGNAVYAHCVIDGGYLVHRINLRNCPIHLLLNMQVGTVVKLETYPIHPAMTTFSIVSQPDDEQVARATAIANACEYCQ